MRTFVRQWTICYSRLKAVLWNCWNYALLQHQDWGCHAQSAHLAIFPLIAGTRSWTLFLVIRRGKDNGAEGGDSVFADKRWIPTSQHKIRGRVLDLREGRLDPKKRSKARNRIRRKGHSQRQFNIFVPGMSESWSSYNCPRFQEYITQSWVNYTKLQEPVNLSTKCQIKSRAVLKSIHRYPG